jgi:hypothetical protein
MVSIDGEVPSADSDADEALCPACSAPMRRHEETLIRLGRPTVIRLRFRCFNPKCEGHAGVKSEDGMTRPYPWSGATNRPQPGANG